jgi:hypothetical protein
VLYIKVLDKDVIGSDDPMGYCAVNLDKLRPGVAIDVWMKLQDVPHGEVHLILSFTPAAGTAAAKTAGAAGAPSAAAGAVVAPAAAGSSAGTVTFTKEEMEAIVRAVFEDGRKFGARDGYNAGFADGTKGVRPETPKLAPGTLSIPPTGVLPAGYIARMMAHGKSTQNVSEQQAHEETVSALTAAPTLKTAVTAEQVSGMVATVHRLSAAAPANKKHISKIDMRVGLLEGSVASVDAECKDRAVAQAFFARCIGVLKSVGTYIQQYGQKTAADDLKKDQEALKAGFEAIMTQLDECFKAAAPYEALSQNHPFNTAVVPAAAAPAGAQPSGPGAPPPPPPAGGVLTRTSADMDAYASKYHNPSQNAVVAGDQAVHVENWGKELEDFMGKFEAVIQAENKK